MSFLNKVKDGFNKLIGTPQDPQSVALARKVDECTSASIVQPDWNLHLQLCQLITFGDVGSNSATSLSCLDRKLGSINPRVQMHALTVCESCVEHCGPAFHEQLAASSLIKRIRETVLDPDNPRSDPQVFHKMMVLIEDWSRALPYTVFTQTLQGAVAAGARVPPRNEEEKAPRYNLEAYDQMRLQQAQQAPLRSRYSSQSMPPGHQGGHDALGAAPAKPQGGSRHGGSERGAPPVGVAPPQIDEAALAELSEADRAAVLAAMAGAQPEPIEITLAEKQDLPKFDCRGSMDQLQMDLAVAAENATLLKDLVQSVETPADDPVVQDLAQRCRQMQAGIQQVIQKVQDDSVMASALQVHEQVSAALEAHGSTRGEERFESQSSLAFGDGAPVDTPPVGVSTQEPHVAMPVAPAAGEASASTDKPTPWPQPARPGANGPDLIDFGDDAQPAQVVDPPLNASNGTSSGAPARLPDSESGSPVAVLQAGSNGVDIAAGDESVDDLAQGVQVHVKVDTNQSDNPFA
eukprot:jgi/Ulvmu1/4899/UM020_0185.1